MFPYREFVPGQGQQQQQQQQGGGQAPQQQYPWQQQQGSLPSLAGAQPPPQPPQSPQGPTPSVLRAAVNAPQFVPKGGSGGTPPFGAQQAPGKLGVQAAPFVPGGSGGGGGSGSQLRSSLSMGDGLNTQAAPFRPGGGAGGGGGSGYYAGADEGMGYDDGEEEEEGPDYYGDDIFDWSVGAASLPAPPRRTLQRMGVPEQLRQFFLLKDLDKLRALPPDDARYKEIPPRYHQAYPLDDESKPRGTAGAMGYPSVIYKVVSHDDGNVYALRRFDGARTTPKIVAAAVDTWRRIQHPNIVRLCKAFVQHGNQTLFFVHEYHPGAQSVMQRYITAHRERGSSQRLPEKLIWSFAVQLVAAVRAVHASGAACRIMLHPSYVLVTTGARLRLGCAGVADVLESETRKPLAELQREDLFLLGRLLLMLGTRAPVMAPQQFPQALNAVAQSYSPDLHALCLQLCSLKPGMTVFDLAPLISRHMQEELDRQYAAVDDLEAHLAHEYESGRLFRLSLKLAQIIERPEHDMDPAWAESGGNRYLLRLFRDYVYHQMDEEGRPVLDLGHIVHSLNRLDVGDPEKIMLMSRDSQTMIIVSFEDVKRCLEGAWLELCEHANANQTIPELALHGAGAADPHGAGVQQQQPRLVPPHLAAAMGGGGGVGVGTLAGAGVGFGMGGGGYVPRGGMGGGGRY